MTNHQREPLRAIRAARVRAARAHADLDQIALGEALGKSVYTVKRLERGMRDISDQELEAIARVCNVPYSFLVAGFAEGAVDLDSLEPLTVGVAEQFFRDALESLTARLDDIERLIQSSTGEELANAIRSALNPPDANG